MLRFSRICQQLRHKIQSLRRSPVQAQVVLSLAQGATVTAAARAAGLHRTTVYHWLNTQPAFETAINQARAEYILTLRDELKTMSSLALADQEKFMQNFSLIEMDYNQLRYEQALGRAERENESSDEIPPAE
jgi:transposase-like protein